MNGAEAAIQSLRDGGVEVCFANPGTTEMHLVAALDAVGGIRPVPALFEGVVTGAADGYARMAGRPALSLLHLGPGFANGIANLHNARRAGLPQVVLIGDHASWHADADAPLASDVESLARPVSAWLRRAGPAPQLGRDAAEALAAARSVPGGVATLIVPADSAWGDGGRAVAALPPTVAPAPDGARVDEAARALREAARPLLLLGPQLLDEAGLACAARVAAASEARLAVDTFPVRLERGAGRPAVEKIPYFPEQVLEMLASVDLLLLVGARAPVAFFGYPGGASRLVPEGCRALELASPEQDAPAALAALADALGTAAHLPPVAAAAPPGLPTGALDPRSLGAAVAALQPEGAIVVEEALTCGLPYWLGSVNAAPHTYLALTGGAIGQGPPSATGAAIACPDRPVIDLQADGSGMYTLQALWTQARESLDVKTIVCANRSYRILRIELARAGVAEPGPAATRFTELSDPALDWVSLARGMGVPGERADSADALVASLRRALATPGPYLVEALL